MLPYAADVWYVAKSVKTGYEISFNRYFHKPEPMRTLEEIRADILAVERETEGLLGRLVPGVGSAAYATAPQATGGLALRELPPPAAKLRVYVDTSVIGGCEDDEFQGPSRRLIERCASGEITLVVSSVTQRELLTAPHAVREAIGVLGDLPEVIDATTDEVGSLADRYIESGVLTEKMRSDAEHIAVATVAGVDVLASWNFRHMVNAWRIRQYNEVNRQMGYPPVDIRTPQEVEDE